MPRRQPAASSSGGATAEDAALLADQKRDIETRKVAEGLLRALEDTVGTVEGLAELVGNFTEDSPGAAERELFKGLGNLTKQLNDVESKRDSLKGLGAAAMVPIDMLSHLDRVDKSNPDLYTKFKVDFAEEERLRLERMKSDFQAMHDALK